MAFRKWDTSWLILFGGLATAGGCLAGSQLPGARWNADAITRELQSVTLEDLTARGPGDNPHVSVTNFTCGSEYAFELQIRKGSPPPTADRPGFGRAWIPLFPKRPPDDVEARSSPTQFVVLLETTPTQASGSGFHRLSRRPSIEGLAMPLRQRPLKGDILEYLAGFYPDTNFSTCWLVVQYEPHEKDDALLIARGLAICTGTGLAVGLPVLVLGILLQRMRTKPSRPSLGGARSRSAAE